MTSVNLTSRPSSKCSLTRPWRILFRERSSEQAVGPHVVKNKSQNEEQTKRIKKVTTTVKTKYTRGWCSLGVKSTYTHSNSFQRKPVKVSMANSVVVFPNKWVVSHNCQHEVSAAQESNLCIAAQWPVQQKLLVHLWSGSGQATGVARNNGRLRQRAAQIVLWSNSPSSRLRCSLVEFTQYQIASFFGRIHPCSRLHCSLGKFTPVADCIASWVNSPNSRLHCSLGDIQPLAGICSTGNIQPLAGIVLWANSPSSRLYYSMGDFTW